jgi:5-methylcytosine-specific restriction protein B
MNENELKEKIKLFTKRAIERNTQATLDIIDNDYYTDYKLAISFGAGQYAKKPWFAFLKDNNQVQQGIYPIISYFYNEKILVVGKGVSDKNSAQLQWVQQDDDYSWNELPAEITACYQCFYKKYYKIEQIDNLTDKILDEIIKFINQIMQEYSQTSQQQTLVTEKILLQSNNNAIKNIILYGSPGVGKTHNTNKLICLIEDGKPDKEIFDTIKSNEPSDSVELSDMKERVKFVTFHQSFGYEDFIEGFRPNGEGHIKLTKGIFREICEEAQKDKENSYYIVIDEINRANISKVFGELITLIEEDKRDKLEVTLPYSKKPFKIPSNLYIIGTMNSTDKSIALIDIALRRRFTFLKMKPHANLIDYQPAKEIFEKLNKRIKQDLGEDYQIGHSYFMKIVNEDDLAFVLEYKIIPLLEEYYYRDDRLAEIIKICNNKEQTDEKN